MPVVSHYTTLLVLSFLSILMLNPLCTDCTTFDPLGCPLKQSLKRADVWFQSYEARKSNRGK